MTGKIPRIKSDERTSSPSYPLSASIILGGVMGKLRSVGTAL
jgi:hypothetical protein